jgi:hypothetical protein
MVLAYVAAMCPAILSEASYHEPRFSLKVLTDSLSKKEKCWRGIAAWNQEKILHVMFELTGLKKTLRF